MARCEDYPCCGHTDGLPCDWTPDTTDPHYLCDHENGSCEVTQYDDDDTETDESDAIGYNDYTPEELLGMEEYGTYSEW